MAEYKPDIIERFGAIELLNDQGGDLILRCWSLGFDRHVYASFYTMDSNIVKALAGRLFQWANKAEEQENAKAR